MSGQMCWLPSLGSNGEKSLHLRLEPHQPWQSYKTFHQFYVPDYPILRGSKGWATHQKLLKAGWTLVPNKQYDFVC
jgi:hypothetical protein